MNKYTIKSLIKKIYNIDYDNIKLENNTELIISRNTNDVHQLLYKRDDISNIHMIPSFETENKNTQTGLFYKDNQIYNHPIYGNPMTSIRFSLTGIKKGSYYRIRIIARGINTVKDLDSNKIYFVLNGTDIIYNSEIPTDKETVIDEVILSEATILNMSLSIGKVAIKDLIIEEVEISTNETKKTVAIEVPNLANLKAYAVLRPKDLPNKSLRITKYPLLRGMGLNVYHNREGDYVLVEPNKNNDVINDNIGNPSYMVTTQIYNGGKTLDHTISSEASPFSGHLGYYTFRTNDITDSTIIYILVHELL